MIDDMTTKLHEEIFDIHGGTSDTFYAGLLQCDTRLQRQEKTMLFACVEQQFVVQHIV